MTTTIEATAGESDRTGDPRPCLVHRQATPVVILIVESLDRRLGFSFRVHLDEPEPLAAARLPVRDDDGTLHRPEWREPPL